ncbi:gliding motility-associated C-terminal domain-containing protein [Spirosoma sp. KCTC 42546]|uniref:gliding motility-associated C-terminal domain-containing protein n=1 Tax=Spirosoma sp. KCTC 42546 TaxID=2520506 RepID=UPI00115B81E3|nr:gliding motility-associated C-terminal domain-containing protein [Spirosoma sp. KCTC 42546]QDK83112.1 gliding motility-associated C-terminal domain-containing protein [Spirosoma sp. KCTC 42546]
MTKQLLNKFIGNYGWALFWLMALPNVMAMSYPLADTCQHPDPPVITGSAKAICRNELVTLTATGCVGTVIWSNGDIGNSITLKPQQTTKYTAICRAKPGCISCFADVWKVTVNTPNAPTVTASSKLICPNDVATLTASTCKGTIHWISQDGSRQDTGSVWTGKLQTTASFRATCEQNNCISNPSIPVSVQVALPSAPTISADKPEICAGQSVQLRASGCVGIVRWMDGSEGIVRTVNPNKTIHYSAVCQVGSCHSDSAKAVSVVVRLVDQKLNLLTTLTNVCPFQTADLSKAITGQIGSVVRYEFRTAPSSSAPAVQSPGAVTAGTYYIFGRNAEGCYTEPVPITVTSTPCKNGIAPCLSNPATVAIRLDSIDWTKGIVQLKGQLGGSATQPTWQSDGGGLFTDTGVNARYLFSETDRQRGTTTFMLSVADPDGSGPCVGMSAQQTMSAPSRELVGLSKKASEPIWVVDGKERLVEFTYQLIVANMGKNALKHVQVADNLDVAFSGVGAQIHSVRVRADSNLAINPAYTGRGVDTTLITGGSLPANGHGRIWLTVQVNVSQASTLTFTNIASAQAIDANGGLCRDRSTNGIDADPDQNGNPADNDEPTTIVLHSLQSEESETVFIPEGFSPNGDGINDRFVIQRVPVGVTIQLDIYNRWGNLVYQNTNYVNDWDGSSNQGVKVADTKQGLPDGTYYYQVRLSDGREFVRFLTLAR